MGQMNGRMMLMNFQIHGMSLATDKPDYHVLIQAGPPRPWNGRAMAALARCPW